MKQIVMIVGSLRKKSFNRQLANEIEKIIGERAKVSYLEYGDLPYMNQDIEFPAPESVSRVRRQILNADAIWICSPEYNYNIPGVLKNLLDWLSRPLIQNNRSAGSAVKGKTVAISGAAGKSAGAGVRESLKNLLEIMGMNVIGGHGTGVALEQSAFLTGVASFSYEDKVKLRKQVEFFLEKI